MYTNHFGLAKLPFENVPDPEFFFSGGGYSAALFRLTESVRAGRGVMAVAGPIGSGKTTLSQKLIRDLPASTTHIWLAEPPADSLELFLLLSQDLGVEPLEKPRSFVVRDIRDQLFTAHREGKRCLLIVDEAHLASDDFLEGVRLLNNLEEGASKLIQIVLLGQHELVDRINRPEMEPLRQRIAGLEVLSRMPPKGVPEYIFHRIRVAEGRAELFTDDSLEGIAHSSAGVPRVINSICDRSLQLAFEQGRSEVDIDVVHQAAVTLGLGRRTMRYLTSTRPTVDRSEDPVADGESEPPAEEAPQSSPPETTAPSTPDERAGRASGLTGPLMIFVSSITALAGSLWFFCARTAFLQGSCVEKLIGLFF